MRDPKRKPTHPGAVLREDVLPALRMTQTEFARRLGVSRLTVSELLLEKRGLSPEIAAGSGGCSTPRRNRGCGCRKPWICGR